MSALYSIDNLSENPEKIEQIEKKFSTNYNYLTNEFILEVKIYQDGILIDSLSQEANPLYDAEKDEGYIEFEGERIYLADCLDIDVLNDCVAFADDIAIGALVASALLITVVVTSPSVQQTITTTVTQVVETVVSAVKSFWSWLTSWITKTFTRTVTTTTTVTTYTPTLTISNVKYETKTVTFTDLKSYPVGKYYLCFVSGGILIRKCLPARLRNGNPMHTWLQLLQESVHELLMEVLILTMEHGIITAKPKLITMANIIPLIRSY